MMLADLSTSEQHFLLLALVNMEANPMLGVCFSLPDLFTASIIPKFLEWEVK